MPVTPPSRGLDALTPEIRTFLQDLAQAVNALEPKLRESTPADAATTTAALAKLQDDFSVLKQQVLAYQPRADEAEEVPVEGQPSLPPTPGPGNPSPGGPALGIIGAGSAMPTVALPDYYATVGGYANSHPAELAASCLDAGGNWSFMDGVVALLQAADARFGYNGKRGDTGDPSQDAVSYYHGILPATLGSPDVYVIDIIGGHCGPNPVPAYSNVTTPRARGAYMATR